MSLPVHALRAALLGCVLLATSCASLKSTPLTDDGTAFFTRLPTRPYQEIAFVEYTGSVFSTRPQLMRRLRQQQAKVQGDALVQVKYDFVFWWPHASAVVVRYQ